MDKKQQEKLKKKIGQAVRFTWEELHGDPINVMGWEIDDILDDVGIRPTHKLKADIKKRIEAGYEAACQKYQAFLDELGAPTESGLAAAVHLATPGTEHLYK